MNRFRRFIPVVLILAAIACAEIFGLTGRLTEALQAHEAAVRGQAEAHPVLAVGAYVATYAILTAACLPVSLILTLAAGALFGGWLGGAATAVASTLGAMICYAAVRLAGEGLGARLMRGEGRLARLVDGFRRDAFGYVLTLRLIPVFPFFLVNAASGLARAPWKAYFAGTALGVIPPSLIYATLGAGLGRVAASGGGPAAMAAAMSPQVLAPLLGLAALAAASVVVRRRAARTQPQT